MDIRSCKRRYSFAVAEERHFAGPRFDSTSPSRCCRASITGVHEDGWAATVSASTGADTAHPGGRN